MYLTEVHGGQSFRTTLQSIRVKSYNFRNCENHLLNTEAVSSFLLQMESVIANDIQVDVEQGKAVCQASKVKLILNRSSDLKQRDVSRAEFMKVVIPCP